MVGHHAGPSRAHRSPSLRCRHWYAGIWRSAPAFSRSSSTTRILGGAVAMPILVCDLGAPAKHFLFRNVSDVVSGQCRATRQRGDKKASLTSLTLPSRRVSRTFGAPMTSISATSSSVYQSPLQKLQDELQTEIYGAIGSSDQDALSSALTDIDTSLQSSRASDQASGTRPALRRPEVEDRRSDCRRGVERQIDQRSGHRNCRVCSRPRSPTAPVATVGQGGPGGAGGAHGHHGGHGGPPPAATVHPRPTAPAIYRARLPQTTFCNSSCNRCRNYCRARHRRPTVRPARPQPEATPAARRSQRC